MVRRFRKVTDWCIKTGERVIQSPFFYYAMTVQERVFDRHKLTTNAAAISFFFLLSIIPMMFIIISIIASFVRTPEEAEKLILQFVAERMPENSRTFLMAIMSKSHISDQVKALMDHKGWISVISIGSLLWTSSGAFAAIEDAMATIFSLKTRNYFVSRLVEMGMVLIVGSLFLLSTMVNAIIQMLKENETQISNIDFSNLPYVWDVFTEVMPYLMTIVTFYVIYKILPKTDIFNRAALLGAVVAGVLLELTIYFFAYYVSNFASYNAFYGSVAGIVITVFSIYLASIILLIGAEVTEIANTKMENARELSLTVKEFD